MVILNDQLLIDLTTSLLLPLFDQEIPLRSLFFFRESWPDMFTFTSFSKLSMVQGAL